MRSSGRARDVELISLIAFGGNRGRLGAQPVWTGPYSECRRVAMGSRSDPVGIPVRNR